MIPQKDFHTHIAVCSRACWIGNSTSTGEKHTLICSSTSIDQQRQAKGLTKDGDVQTNVLG